MPSALDYVTRARQKLGIHADEEPLEAHDLAKGIDALADILMRWTANGTISAFAGLNAETDTVTLTLLDGTVWTFEANSAIIANLAMGLADDYGRKVSPMMAKDAVEGEAMLVLKGMAGLDRVSQFDTGLRMPSQGVLTTEIDNA
jgi:hypothetical protein